jgi:PST family polysaccharide transporter
MWSFLREGVSELITTPTAIIMARLLSPFDFGVAASAAFFLMMATRLTNFGFNVALVRIKELRPEHCSSVFVVNLGLGILAYATLVSTAELMGAFFRAPQVAQVIPIAAVTFLIGPFATVPAALMSRHMQFQRSAVVDWIGGLGEAISAILFAWAGYGFWSIVYARLIAEVLSSGTRLALGGWMPRFTFSLEAMKEVFPFGAGLFLKRLLDYAATHVDNVVVGRMLGVATLGFYDKAFVTVGKVLMRINRGGPMVSFRVFALIHEEEERFRQAFRKVVLAAGLLTYPLLIGLAAAASEVIGVLYGERWLPSVPAFQLLCLAGMLKVTNEYAGMAAQASGRIWNQVWRQSVYTALIVVLVGVGSRWGLTGAAAGVLAATLAMTMLMNGLLMHTTAISLRALLGAQLPGAVAALAVGFAVSGARFLLMPLTEARWQLLGGEVLAAAFACVLFLKLNRFREVRPLLRDTVQDLSPRLARIVTIVS